MVIDKNIPISKRCGPRTELGRLAREMEVGDSVLCATERERDSLRWTLHDLGRVYASRKVDGGWRVWRRT